MKCLAVKEKYEIPVSKLYGFSVILGLGFIRACSVIEGGCQSSTGDGYSSSGTFISP